MATNETSSALGKPAWTLELLLAARPLVALVAVLLTTAGHPMTLREMGVGKGWVAAEVYALQSCYLVSLALMMVACPALGRRWSCRSLAQGGLVLVAAGSFLNGLETSAPLEVFLAARVMAGAGAGLVIYFVPHLIDHRWRGAVTWAVILCPVAGPGVISAASMMHEVSDWQLGFILEGVTAVAGLVVLLSMEETTESPSPAGPGSMAYLTPLVVGVAALFYVLHWGQLHGWLESPDILAASVVAFAALAISLGIAWPRLDWVALNENGIRLVLLFYGGMCQFFYGYAMNTYGGTLINFSSWQRAWLIWPLPIGVAASLAASALLLRRGRVGPGLPGALVGLLLLAGGLYLCHQQTMEWPYWTILVTNDLNWFPAPQHWELAPGRFLMGLGIGLFMVAMDAHLSPDPRREQEVRPFLPIVQFFGGGVAAAVLVNFLMIGHQVYYSYSSDRGDIQAAELAIRKDVLRGDIPPEGQTDPARSVEVQLYRFVNYEADNLVFALIYASFVVSSLVLAGVCLVLWVQLGAHPPPGPPVS